MSFGPSPGERWHMEKQAALRDEHERRQQAEHARWWASLSDDQRAEILRQEAEQRAKE